MMEHLTECAICGVTLPPLTKGHLCAEHQAWHNGWYFVPLMGQLRLAILCGDPRYNDFRWPHNHKTAMTVNPQTAQMPLPPYIDPRVFLWEMEKRARLWLDGGDQGWGRGAA